MRYVLQALVICLLISCSLKPIHHGVINPQVTHQEAKNQALNIVIANTIEDKIVVAGGRASTLSVYEFRTTVKDALKKIFEKDFRSVEFSEDTSKSLTLILQNINAVWDLTGTVYHDHNGMTGADGKPVMNLTTGIYRCVIRNSAVLKYNGEIISQVTENVTEGQPNEWRAYQQDSFLKTLQLSFENFHSSILTPQVYSKL